MPKAIRVQTGVAKRSDGWHVVQAFTYKVGSEFRVYEPPFDTEAEAEEIANKLALNLRADLTKLGIRFIPREGPFYGSTTPAQQDRSTTSPGRGDSPAH